MRGSGIIRAGLTLLAAGVCGCSSLVELGGKPEVREVRPRIKEIGFRGLVVDFEVDIHNPYLIPIRTPLVSYGVQIQQHEFMTSEASATVGLPAETVETVHLPFQITYSSLRRVYHDLKDAKEVEYRLHGTVSFSVLGHEFLLPLGFSGTLPLMRPPQFKNVRFRLSDVSLSKARITIEAVVENPNVFELDIRELGYLFKVGTVKLAGLTASTVEKIPPSETGRLLLVGEVSAAKAILELARGRGLGKAALEPSGFLKTPYGRVRLPD